MKKRLILPLTIALAALIGGCIWHFLSDRKGTMQLLEQAEAVMREHPDSAYRLLCGIDSTRQLRGESQARYALLMTQAQYKNGIPLPSDSLISIAYDYYCASSDSLHKAWACFYMGQATRDGGNQRDALRYFQQAASAGESTNNYNMLSLIYQHWGNLLKPFIPYKEGMSKLLKAQEYALRGNDTLTYIHSCINLSRCYIYLKQFERNYQQLEKARSLSREINDTTLLFKTYAESAFAYDEGKNYILAKIMLDSAKHYTQTPKDFEVTNQYNAFIFYHTRQYDSASHYMTLVKDSSSLINKAIKHQQLYKINKGLKNLPLAFYHLERYAQLLDSVFEKDSETALMPIQHFYNYSQYKIQNLTLESQRRKLFATIFGLIAIIIAGCYFFYVLRSRNKRRTEAILRSKDALLQKSSLHLTEKNEKLLLQNQALLEAEKLLEKQKQELKEQAARIDELQTEKPNNLQTDISNNEKELAYNRKRQMELREQVLRINETARKILRLAANPNNIGKLKRTEVILNEEERKSLFLAIDLCYDNIITRLHLTYKELSDDDLFYCCLLKMGISQEIACLLLSTNPTALKKRKYRIKNEKIEQAHSYNSLEDFLQQF